MGTIWHSFQTGDDLNGTRANTIDFSHLAPYFCAGAYATTIKSRFTSRGSIRALAQLAGESCATGFMFIRFIRRDILRDDAAARVSERGAKRPGANGTRLL